MKKYLVLLCSLIVSVFVWCTPALADAGATTTTSGAFSTNSSFTPNQVKEIQKIIYNYLITNPEVLVKASQALQEKQAAKSQKDALSAIQTHTKEIFNDPSSPTAGNPNGSIEVVEFFDYQCGHCKAMAPTIIAAVKNNAKVKLILKELPIFGGSSRYAAKAALASTKQGKYYAFHNALFSATTALDPQIILKIAKKTGLDVKKLKQEMNAPWVEKQLRDNFQLAQSLKLIGTPAFIISNKNHTKIRFIPGATSQQNFNQQIADVSQ